MENISEEDFKKLNTVEDFQGLKGKVNEVITTLQKEIFAELENTNTIEDLHKLFTKQFHLGIRYNTEAEIQSIIDSQRIGELESVLGETMKIVLKEMKKNKTISKESGNKLNELDDKIKNIQKSRSIFGNLSLSLFKNDMTGIGLD